MARSRLAAFLAVAQGLYFAATGLWPLLSMRTFLKLTGAKIDLWLVKTVGVLVTVIGAVLTLAGVRRRVAPEIAVLAVGSAAGLAGIDVAYVSRERIPRIYLLDAVGEVVFIVGWAVAVMGGRRKRRKR